MHIATKSSKIDISSEEKVCQLGQKFSKILNKNDFIFLYGEIGSGKTTFVRYLINSFQKNENLKITEIPSPTFNLVYEYKTNKILKKHYDLYRLKEKREIQNIGLFEDNSEILTIVEWPEKIERKPKERIDLYFEYKDDFKKRSLFLKGFGKWASYDFE